MHTSRLARAAERKQLTQPAISPLIFPNKQSLPRPQRADLTLEQLVPMLVAQGLKPGLKIGGNDTEGVLVIIATLGPLEIPLTFKPAEAALIRDAVTAACERITPPAAEQIAESTDPDRDAELLAEATKNLKGDHDEDDENELGYVMAAEACTDA